MERTRRSGLLRQLLYCWNWKCALLSATIRSLVYTVAMVHTQPVSKGAVVLVEVAYVTMTAGIYAALQQRALEFRAKWMGDLTVVLGVPSLAQLLD